MICVGKLERRLKEAAERLPAARGVLPLGRGVRPASQNRYPIYDQNLRFFLPYLWLDQKFDVLFTNIAAGTVALNIMHLSMSPGGGGGGGVYSGGI